MNTYIYTATTTPCSPSPWNIIGPGDEHDLKAARIMGEAHMLFTKTERMAMDDYLARPVVGWSTSIQSPVIYLVEKINADGVGVAGCCRWGGHVIEFARQYIRALPDDLLKIVFVHEIMHLYCFAINGHSAHINDLNREIEIDCRLKGIGLNQGDLAKWIVLQKIDLNSLPTPIVIDRADPRYYPTVQ